MQLDEPKSMLKPMTKSCEHCKLTIDQCQHKKEKDHSNVKSVEENMPDKSVTFPLTHVPTTDLRICNKEPSKPR